MRNIDLVLEAVEKNPQGIDDDEISQITDVKPRQQVYQICTRLVAEGRIRRLSIDRPGKRKKIHNFPVSTGDTETLDGSGYSNLRESSWERRLCALQAATGLQRSEILDRALREFAIGVLASDAVQDGEPGTSS